MSTVRILHPSRLAKATQEGREALAPTALAAKGPSAGNRRTTFPLQYSTWARKPDNRIYRVIVTVDTPDSWSRSEWTGHFCRSEREARRDVAAHNLTVQR